MKRKSCGFIWFALACYGLVYRHLKVVKWCFDSWPLEAQTLPYIWTLCGDTISPAKFWVPLWLMFKTWRNKHYHQASQQLQKKRTNFVFCLKCPVFEVFSDFQTSTTGHEMPSWLGALQAEEIPRWAVPWSVTKFWQEWNVTSKSSLSDLKTILRYLWQNQERSKWTKILNQIQLSAAHKSKAKSQNK